MWQPLWMDETGSASLWKFGGAGEGVRFAACFGSGVTRLTMDRQRVDSEVRVRGQGGFRDDGKGGGSWNCCDGKYKIERSQQW